MSEKIEYEQHESGDCVTPAMGKDGPYRWQCCGCGLTHKIEFEAGRIRAGKFIPDPTGRVRMTVFSDDEETAKAREGEETDTTPAPTVKKPRQTPPKGTKGTKPAPEGTGTRQRAGKAPQGARKPRQKPTATDFQTGSHISAKDRNFCWASVPENDEAGEE